MIDTSRNITLAQKIMDHALASGAEHAEVMLVHSHARQVQMRQGLLSESEEENDISLGIRVFTGTSSAIVSGNDLSDAALKRLSETALQMAHHTPGDKETMPAEAALLEPFQENEETALDLYDPADLLDQNRLNETVARLEARGLSHPDITKSDGAAASHAHTHTVLMLGRDYAASRMRSHFSTSLMLIAGEGEAMERDYAYDTVVHHADSKTTDQIADLAANRTRARLNPKPGKTGTFPVMIDRRVAGSILRHFARAINGGAILRKTSFLGERLGQTIFNPSISIMDDPLRKRGLASAITDSEGLKRRRQALVTDGVLNHFLLDLRSARRLNLSPNGCARRGLSSPPSPGSSNLSMQAGSTSVADMIADIKDGFYVTEFMGSQISMTTGDYSRGASGFWIANGTLTHPVSQMTIAGNLKDMFMDMIPADDLELRQSVESPSLLIRKMACASSA